MPEDMVCVLSCFRISRGRIARILPALELKRLHPTVALLQLTPLQRRRKAKKKTGKLEAQKLEDEKQLVRLGALDLPFTIRHGAFTHVQACGLGSIMLAVTHARIPMTSFFLFFVTALSLMLTLANKEHSPCSG